ncbi:MAG: hypothetical protein EOP84_00490 [Verrucomicrobiaceae bacterium]|nr:MAG: hypothetical protein EOP84_00490 [Verrucomicrobiaceae bacterium]
MRRIGIGARREGFQPVYLFSILKGGVVSIKFLVRAFPAVLFFVFLLAPTFWYLTRYPRIEPLEEFRALAERPKVGDYFEPGKPGFLEFTKQLDAWFSDQFPTRPVWVRMYTQALYAFRESDQVHVGSQGWLYYRSVIDEETPALEAKDPAFRKQMIDEFARVSDLMKQRGVTLVVMPVALKARYYPEFLPPSAEHAKKFKFFDLFMDEFVKDGRVDVIDTRVALQDAKASGLKIFHRTDFHWTDAGGAVALRLLAEDLAAREGDPAIAELWQYEYVVEENVSGGQARALPLFRKPTETTVSVRPTSPTTYFDDVRDQPWAEWSGISLPGQGKRLSPVVVYGDSFFDAGVRSGFFNLFRAFARGRIFAHDPVELFRNRPAGARYFVWEFITSGTFAAEAAAQRMINALEADPSL